MQSVNHFRDEKVLVWQHTDFDRQSKAAALGDEWASDPYEFLDEQRRRAAFYITFQPKNADGGGLLNLFVIDGALELSCAAACEAWLETIEGTVGNSRKRTDCKLMWYDSPGWPLRWSKEELDFVRNSPTVFVCVRFPFEIKKFGSPLSPAPTHRHKLNRFQGEFEGAAFKDRWESKKFRANGVGGTDFILTFFPKNDQDNSKEYASMYLKKLKPQAKVHFTLWIENSKKERTRKVSFNYIYPDCTAWGEEKLIEQRALVAFAGGRPITLCCEFRPIGPAIGLSEAVIEQAEVARTFNDQRSSDAMIQVGERTFHVSRSVLEQSTRFAECFRMKQEDQENIVSMPNIDADTAERMLRFMYTGEVKELDRVAGSLLAPAAHYGLEPLQKKCIDFISANLSLDNLKPALEWAIHRQDVEKFLCQLLTFAYDNRKKWMRTPEWRQLLREIAEAVKRGPHKFFLSTVD